MLIYWRVIFVWYMLPWNMFEHQSLKTKKNADGLLVIIFEHRIHFSPYFLVHISRLLTVLVWAITNTPIPSHCTDLHWLVKGYPYHSRMKGHNRPRLTAECNTLKLTSQLVNQSTIMFKYINMVDGKKHIIYLVAKSHQQVYILK